VHFNLFGVVPNLVFILFFLLVFFQWPANNYKIIIIAVAAGIILDIFSYTYIGPSVILLTGIAFLLKGVRSLLKNTENSYPFAYFLPLFVLFFLVYDLFRGSYLYFLDSDKIALIISTQIIFSVIYNAIIASLLFYVYKKVIKEFGNGKDL